MPAPFFDTNILVDWLFDRQQAIDELARYTRHWLSRIVWTEVLAGEPPASRDMIAELLQPFEVVEVDRGIAATAVDIRYRTHMKLMDALVLATAQVNGAVLITRNTRDFPATTPGVRIPYIL